MNTKMQKMLRGNPYVSATVSVLASVLAVSGIVYAATTIGNNVSVDGTLTQTGAASFAGAVSASSTMAITGNTYTIGTLGVGTTSPSTTFGVIGSGYFTAGLGVGVLNTTSGQLVVSGSVGIASSTPFAGNALGVAGTTTTLGLRVGGSGTAFNQVVAGFCNIPDTTITASSTDFADCAGATGVAANDRVFVMATSSLPTNLMIRAASSSAVTANAINVEIFNTGLTPNTNTTGNISFNFWAFK